MSEQISAWGPLKVCYRKHKDERHRSCCFAIHSTRQRWSLTPREHNKHNSNYGYCSLLLPCKITGECTSSESLWIAAFPLPLFLLLGQVSKPERFWSWAGAGALMFDCAKLQPGTSSWSHSCLCGAAGKLHLKKRLGSQNVYDTKFGPEIQRKTHRLASDGHKVMLQWETWC